MIRSIYFESKKPSVYLKTIEEIREKLPVSDGFVWVSLESASDEEIQQVLLDTFHFHPLAVEDCQSIGY